MTERRARAITPAMGETTTAAAAAATAEQAVAAAAPEVGKSPPTTMHHQDGRTVVRAIYPRARGRLALRGGSAGLDWFQDRQPDSVDGDISTFHLDVPHFDPVQLKVVRVEDGKWMVGRNAVVGRGDFVMLRPAFDREKGELSGMRWLEIPDGPSLAFRVRLPPSYGEQESLRYPVLYAQDGQSVWSDGTDPFGTWGLDRILDDLGDVGALDEIIVVSVDTGEDRLHKLAPVPDPHHGGGGAGAHLSAILDHLKPLIDREFRTMADRKSTVMLGSSMGGLFSMWSAWTRNDVIGGAICLSPSFWWGERFMMKLVSGPSCPAPRPNLYIDSGAAASGFEEDAATRDGVHNARAVYRALREHCYVNGTELNLLTWTGHHHNSESWAARIAVPLQLFFPRST